MSHSVDIPDLNLRSVIEKKLGKIIGDPISEEDMVLLKDLEMPESNVQDLTGLEYAKNLIRLSAGNNLISTLWPLTELVNLKWVDLWGNSISDIKPLAALKRLEGLWVQNNSIENISTLEHLTKLKSLSLHDNNILDLSPLERLTRLEGLEVDINSISDLLLLKGLRSLEQLKIEIEGPLPLKCLLDRERIGGPLRVHVRKFT